MDPKFLESFINRSHVVMGCRLRPFSLWHYVCLDLAQSPFVGWDKPKNFFELIKALRICSLNPDAAFKCADHALRVSDVLNFLLAVFFPELFLARQLEAFQIYINDYSAPPHFWQRSGGKSSPLPWVLLIVARLMGFGGFSELEAWSLPIGKAIWYQAAFLEINGADSGVISAEELEALEEAGWEIP